MPKHNVLLKKLCCACVTKNCSLLLHICTIVLLDQIQSYDLILEYPRNIQSASLAVHSNFGPAIFSCDSSVLSISSLGHVENLLIFKKKKTRL
jgi:hypothetical protein